MSVIGSSSVIGNGGGSAGINLSFTEQNTGLKHTDGKDIFQITINFGALPNNAAKPVAHGIAGIDTSWVMASRPGFTRQLICRWICCVTGTKRFTD